MDITNLTLLEISDMMKPHISNYFKDSKILDEAGGMFQETVMLYGEEVRHLIPAEYNKRVNDDDTFSASSGFIRVDTKTQVHRGKEYTAMLLHTDTQAITLHLQEQDNTTHASRDILLADFTKQAQHQQK